MKKLFIIFAILCLAAPAMAADWNFYGSARMTTWANLEDNSANDDRNSLDMGLQGNSRFGAKVKANDNGIGGKFEYGTGVNLRLLYGTWDFGGGTLLLGQDYTPSNSGNAWISNQVWGVDNDLIWYGMPYIGRRAQIKLKAAGFAFAMIEPVTPLPPGYEVTGAGGISGSIESTFPMMETSYNYETDAFFVRPYLGYNTYIVQQTDGRDRTLNSWLGGFTFGVTPGAFFFKGGAFYAQNPSTYGISMETEVNTSYDAATSEITDVDAFGFQVVAGFVVSDAVTIEVGGGMATYDEDLDEDFSDREADATDWSIYGNTSITLAPGFFIVPELGYRDREDVGTNDNNAWYLGAKWQINF